MVIWALLHSTETHGPENKEKLQLYFTVKTLVST
ncbi:hypothetical protein AG1IA_08045 [Rhizoctonia solani AG-1 IA]|uniref:Uncharacterized protein n=1 Tax=Thanatephorus cucumeris (strain AG1-IA) TaxID=983506 RepID=L8WMD0_THACA|nr:hypothetical protein AG1IA_08045 [Rhizoctonia solani AG-1 IA]